MMDDDFEELTCEGELLSGSSQESLTGAATNLSFAEDVEQNSLYHTFQIPEEYEYAPANLPRALAEEEGVNFAVTPTSDVSSRGLRSYPNADVTDKIEDVFEQIADAMLNDKKEISITLKTRRRVPTDKQSDEDLTRTLSFPGKTENEAWRFAVVIRILELMHEALRTDVVMSKRDMYYKDPALFGSQSHVDRYVDDIAFTFGVTRTALNVTAVAKGLIAGAATFCRRDGSILSTANDQGGVLIPALKDILSVDMSAVSWILVVEKEATFRSIASSFWKRTSAEGVIMTGKGYPDLASRALLHFLSTASPRNGFASPPVYGLADFDPDGMAILSVYKHGSKALAHEKEGHCVPQLQHLGLRSDHLLIDGNDSQAVQGIMMLTPRDRRKAIGMMEPQNTAGDGVDVECAAALRTMLMLNMKAELQLLDGVSGNMILLLETMRGRL